MFLGRWSLEGFSLIRDVLRTTTHAPCQIRNIRGMWTSQSDMLCIRHCGHRTGLKATRARLRISSSFGRRLGALLGKGYRMRFEGRCTDGQN